MTVEEQATSRYPSNVQVHRSRTSQQEHLSGKDRHRQLKRMQWKGKKAANYTCRESFSSKHSNPMAHATQYNAIELRATQGGYTGINRVNHSGEIPTIKALRALDFKVIDWDGR